MPYVQFVNSQCLDQPLASLETQHLTLIAEGGLACGMCSWLVPFHIQTAIDVQIYVAGKTWQLSAIVYGEFFTG